MPTLEVLSTNVLHRFRIFAIVEQALRSGDSRVLAGDGFAARETRFVLRHWNLSVGTRPQVWSPRL